MPLLKGTNLFRQLADPATSCKQCGHHLRQVPAGEAVAGYPRGLGRGKIARLIADQKARFPIYRPTAKQVKDHTWTGLAPVADATIGSVSRIRVIRAITNV